MKFFVLIGWALNVFPGAVSNLLFDCRTGWGAAKAILLFCKLAEAILGSSIIGFVVGGAAVVQLSQGGQIPRSGDGHSTPK